MYTPTCLLTGDMVLNNDWNDKSRMTGDCHVRFCERLRLRCLCLLDFAIKGVWKIKKTTVNELFPADTEQVSILSREFEVPARLVIKWSPAQYHPGILPKSFFRILLNRNYRSKYLFARPLSYIHFAPCCTRSGTCRTSFLP